MDAIVFVFVFLSLESLSDFGFVRFDIFYVGLFIISVDDVDGIYGAGVFQGFGCFIPRAQCYIHAVFYEYVFLPFLFLQADDFIIEIGEDIAGFFESFFHRCIQDLASGKAYKSAWYAVSCTVYRGKKLLPRFCLFESVKISAYPVSWFEEDK